MKNYEEKDNMFSVMINICTRVVTIIFIFATIIPLLAGNKAQHWSISDIWGVLAIGAISGLLFGFFYTLEKSSRLQLNIFWILYFLLINALVLGIGLKLYWFSTNIKSVLIMEGMFLLVFFAVYILVYMFDFNQAKKINQKLQDRKNHKAEE